MGMIGALELQDGGLGRLGAGMKWQWFEKLAAMVFGENGFAVRQGEVRMFGATRRQYDIIAEGPRFIIAADCKRWSGNRGKASQAKRAAEAQAERCGLLRQGNPKEIIPMIITLGSEGISVHPGVPVVPIGMLNSFLNSIEEYEGLIRRI